MNIKELFNEENIVVMIPNTNLQFNKYDYMLEKYDKLNVYKTETEIINSVDLDDIPINYYVEKLQEMLLEDCVLLEEEDIKNSFVDLLSKGKTLKTKMKFIKTVEP